MLVLIENFERKQVQRICTVFLLLFFVVVYNTPFLPILKHHHCAQHVVW